MPKIDFLHPVPDSKARRATIIVAVVFTLFVGVLSAIGAGASYRAATHGTTVFNEVGNVFPLSSIRHIVWGTNPSDSASDPIATPDDRLNILLLGVGGEGHDGAQLTDTMILASFDKATNKLGLISIPRDLGYPLGGGRYQKINSLNVYHELEHPGEGA